MTTIKKKPDANAFANLIKAAKGESRLTPSTPVATVEPTSDAKLVIPIGSIRVRVRFQQPRKHFDDVRMMELEHSIRKKGIEDPLVVRPLEPGVYELVDGERRYRSARNVGLTEVPVLVRDLNDKDALEYSLTKFLLSEDLNPVEETQGILNLLSLELDRDQEEVISLLYRMDNEAKGKVTHNVMGNEETQIVESLLAAIGMSWESFVKNRLPLLKLPEDVLGVLNEGQIAYTKAQAIARIKDKQQRQSLLGEAISQELSLSQIQERVKTWKAAVSRAESAEPLGARLDNAFRRVKRAKLWKDPKKKVKLEKLLTQLEGLLEEETL